jgi:hypothetical protein
MDNVESGIGHNGFPPGSGLMTGSGLGTARGAGVPISFGGKSRVVDVTAYGGSPWATSKIRPERDPRARKFRSIAIFPPDY